MKKRDSDSKRMLMTEIEYERHLKKITNMSSDEYHKYLVNSLQRGIDDINEGKLISHEVVMEKMEEIAK